MKFRTFKYNIIRAIKVINHAVNAETMKMLGGILIDANAPDMVELTAYSNDIKIKYYVRAEFMQMIERGKFVSEQGKTKVPVTLELKDDVLKCNGRNIRCQLKDEIDADIAGNIKIGFNADFLMDMIKTIRSDNVVLELKSQKDALIIKDGDTELLLLPVIV